MNIENIYDNVIRKTNDISQITGSMLYHHHMVKKYPNYIKHCEQIVYKCNVHL